MEDFQLALKQAFESFLNKAGRQDFPWEWSHRRSKHRQPWGRRIWNTPISQYMETIKNMLGLTIWSRTQLSSRAMCLRMIANNACFSVNNYLLDCTRIFHRFIKKVEQKTWSEQRMCICHFVTFLPPKISPLLPGHAHGAILVTVCGWPATWAVGWGVEYGADIAIF